MKDEIEREPVEISSVAKTNHLRANTLTKQYREYLSSYKEFKKKEKVSLFKESFVIPKNFSANMGIDETGLINGELYTVLINKNAKGRKGSLAGLIKGTESRIVTGAIMESVSFETRIAIEEITLDLSNSMDWIARQIAPNSMRTYDRFHVDKLVAEAVQTIRVAKRWEAIEEENNAIKNATERGEQYKPTRLANGDTEKQLLARSRYLLFKHKSKWTPSQADRAKVLFKRYPEIKAAYELYIKFKNCFRLTKQKAKEALEKWIEQAISSGIKEFITVATTISNKLGGIVNYFVNHSSNAALENFNAKLKMLKRRIRGINDRDFFFFRVLIYYA